MRLHLDLTNLPVNKFEAEAKVEKLNKRFGGKTYMDLSFHAYPVGGSFNVCVRGNADSEEELSEMVMGLFTDGLME